MMMEINKLIRKNIRDLQPYTCARDEYNGENAVLLDANENPFETRYNRYPDPYQQKLKATIADLRKVAVNRMLLGNGSDEIIDLLIRSVCEPGVNNIIVFSPGYSMYEVSAAINAVEVKKINLTPAFLPDWEEMKRQIDRNTRIIFLCTPNNPTGKVIPYEQIATICREFSGFILVDEAYIDFTEERSAVDLLDQYPNVVVLQTLSKAWGMAGLRLGVCFASPDLISILNKVKAPYNISSLTQETAFRLLTNYEEFQRKCIAIKTERARLLEELRNLNLFDRVYDSEANFILVTSQGSHMIYQELISQNIVVRLRDIPPLISGGIRITVGTPKENMRLIKVLSSIKPIVDTF